MSIGLNVLALVRPPSDRHASVPADSTTSVAVRATREVTVAAASPEPVRTSQAVNVPHTSLRETSGAITDAATLLGTTPQGAASPDGLIHADGLRLKSLVEEIRRSSQPVENAGISPFGR